MTRKIAYGKNFTEVRQSFDDGSIGVLGRLTRTSTDTRNTVISAASASKLPNKTVLLAESGGKDAVISLEVFHQLHCLVRLDPLK